MHKLVTDVMLRRRDRDRRRGRRHGTTVAKAGHARLAQARHYGRCRVELDATEGTRTSTGKGASLFFFITTRPCTLDKTHQQPPASAAWTSFPHTCTHREKGSRDRFSDRFAEGLARL